MAHRRRIIVLVFALSGLLLLFQNCGFPKGSSDSSALARPDFICGEVGYQYLLNAYIEPNCGSCHHNGGFVEPYFADKDFTSSFAEAKKVSSTRFYVTTTENNFCIGDCNLKQGTELYDDFQTWLSNRDCP